MNIPTVDGVGLEVREGALLSPEDLCHERTPDDSPGPCTHAVCHRTGPHTEHRAWSNDGTLLKWGGHECT